MAKTVLIVANTFKPLALSLADSISAELRKYGYNSSILEFTSHQSEFKRPDDCCLIITLGGDGTVLYATHHAAPFDIPILPFNLGTLGFIANFSEQEWQSTIQKWHQEELMISRRMMLKASLWRGQKNYGEFMGLNETVISSSGMGKMVELEVRVRGIHLGYYRADGFMVATPTGSTAYNLAAGGPIVQPEMEAMVLNPICPFKLSNRPLIVSANQAIDIEVHPSRDISACLFVDGHGSASLKAGDHVTLTASAHHAKIYTKSPSTFYEVLQKKLNWAAEPNFREGS